VVRPARSFFPIVDWRGTGRAETGFVDRRQKAWFSPAVPCQGACGAFGFFPLLIGAALAARRPASSTAGKKRGFRRLRRAKAPAARLG
jgi:hypothetical protein